MDIEYLIEQDNKILLNNKPKKKHKGSVLFDQFINGVWVFIGYSTQLKSGHECRISQNKINTIQMTFPPATLLERIMAIEKAKH